MQCYSQIINRNWTRVQDPISIYPDSFTKSPAEIEGLQMLHKCTILQHRKNSTQLNKKQKYSQIAKGFGQKSFATQNERGYTNPNIKGFQRVKTINTTLNGVPINLPVTSCNPPNIIPDNTMPDPISPNDDEVAKEPPPPIVPSNDNTTTYPIEDQTNELPVVIQNLGSLICGTQENICTGEITEYSANNRIISHPTSASDVPGTIRDLHWNPSIPYYEPKKRTTMNTSGYNGPNNYIKLQRNIPDPNTN